MQIQAKIGGILYCGGKPGSNYPDLEPGTEFWNQVQIPSSDYKSLVIIRMCNCRIQNFFVKMNCYFCKEAVTASSAIIT